MVLFVSIKTTKALAQAVDIGTVEQVSGYARIERDKDYDVITDFGIQSYDKAQTEAGRMGIRFIDDTSIRITEHSMVVIDEFVFDANPDNSRLALNFVKGTARFTSSLTNKISKKNIKLTTNSAVVGIRGTDFTITVEPDTGKSLFILLPDKDGNPSGEISVTTAMGTVILNKPYQATTTRVYEAPPSNPVILDLSLDFINNMLLIAPPEEDKDIEESTEKKQENNLLDFDELDVDYLADDSLDKDELEFTELDYDALNVNFLEDLLDIITELDVLDNEKELTQTISAVNIEGTTIGQDQKTQITTIVSGQEVKLTRSVASSTSIQIDSGESYLVVLEQDGVTNQVKVNGGGSSVIVIRQSQ
tara:strand:+ start:2711 stop:3796 length:1086 start_codon:yes stop_codon:yes gene_type:complete